MNATEWIAQRREKTTLFRDRFGDTAGVGGVVALVAEDLPRALDALEAVLEWADRRGVDVGDDDRPYRDGYRAAQRRLVTHGIPELITAIETALRVGP